MSGESAAAAATIIRRTFEGSYQQVRNDMVMEVCRLLQPHQGEVIQNAAADAADAAEEIEVEETGEELEVNGYCNMCSANWTEEEERELQFLFFPCGHSYHFKCFGNYILENIRGIQTIWRENTAQKCAIELVIDMTACSTIKCMICEYFDTRDNCNSICGGITPDAMLKVIYHPLSKMSSVWDYSNVNQNLNHIPIYYREQDIDELEQYFQLGDIICFQEAPQELYILDINMLKKPCFKKCAHNIIPYKFVQMFGYRHYRNSIYSPLVNILPLDNEEKEYWDLENARIIRREFLDYDIEEIPEVKEIEEDEEMGSLQIMENNIIHILDEDKQWVALAGSTAPIIPMTYTSKKSFEYYFDWFSIHQTNLQLSISTFEVLDVESRAIVCIPMKIANADADNDVDD